MSGVNVAVSGGMASQLLRASKKETVSGYFLESSQSRHGQCLRAAPLPYARSPRARAGLRQPPRILRWWHAREHLWFPPATRIDRHINWFAFSNFFSGSPQLISSKKNCLGMRYVYGNAGPVVRSLVRPHHCLRSPLHQVMQPACAERGWAVLSCAELCWAVLSWAAACDYRLHYGYIAQISDVDAPHVPGH